MSSPPGFPSNAIRSIPSGEFETRESAPGFDTRENKSMLGNDRGLYVHAQPPSQEEMRPGQKSLVASGTRGLGTTTEYGSSPGFDDIVPKNISKPGLESHTTYTSYNEAPGYSANARQNTSATATSNTTTPTSANQVDYTGISLIGSRFKAVNPDPYTISRKNEN